MSALAVMGASTTLTAGAPGTYKEERWGCLSSLNSGAGPAAAPCYPPRGNCPTTPHPRWTSTSLENSLRAQVVIKSRTAKHCLQADHLSDRLTLQEINCFICIVLRFLFIDDYTVCWKLAYYIITCNITSWAYYSYTTSFTTHVFYE